MAQKSKTTKKATANSADFKPDYNVETAERMMQLEQEIKAAKEQLQDTVEELETSNEELKSINEELKSTIEERDILIRDIHHRVKNNMTLLVSLLSLEQKKLLKRGDKKEEYIDSIESCKSKIHILSSIYTHLYEHEKQAEFINSNDYLSNLIVLISKSNITNKRIVLRKEIDNVKISINKAIPLGLIINEIITNSYKHAFKNTNEGEIYVGLKMIKGKNLSLIVKDNGSGIEGDYTKLQSKTLGFTLIDALVGQIGGKLNISSNNGVSIDINFKE